MVVEAPRARAVLQLRAPHWSGADVDCSRRCRRRAAHDLVAGPWRLGPSRNQHEEPTTPRHTHARSESALEIREEPLGKRSGGLLRLRGVATYREAPMLRERLFATIDHARGAPTIVDLQNVERMDTAALAVLVEGLARSLEQGGDLYLTAPRQSVRRVFELAGLPEALDRCFSCIEEVGPASRLRALTVGPADRPRPAGG